MKPCLVFVKAVAGIALIIAVFALPLVAQPSPATASKAVKSASDEVILDIVVRDKKGKPVTDLEPGDITVLDNGAKQQFTDFRLIHGAEATGPKGAKLPLDPLHQMRLVVLVFETPTSLARSDTAGNLQTGGISARQGSSGDTSAGAATVPATMPVATLALPAMADRTARLNVAEH